MGPVFAAVGVLGIEETVVQPGLIAEEKEALGVGIEATERIDVGRQTEVGEGAPTRSGLGGELREDAVGFVESEKHAVAEEGSGVQSLHPCRPSPSPRSTRSQLQRLPNHSPERAK